jgi:uncharacterized protein with PIN domain
MKMKMKANWWTAELEPKNKNKEFSARCPYCNANIEKIVYKIVDLEDYEYDTDRREARLFCCPNCNKVLGVVEW